MADRSLAATATFGLFDGVTSALGVVVGLVAAGASPHTILVAAAGLAVAAAVGMAFGDYLAGASTRSASVMGAASLLGSLIPALPVVAWPGMGGDYASLALVLAVAVVIAQVRGGTPRDYTTTAATLAIASGLSIAVSLLLGVTG
jgi:hypothetical protein